MWSDPERREEMKRRITEGIHKSDSDYYVRNKPKKAEETYHVPDLDGEVWKDIEGFEGHYAVSNLGRVKSLSRTLPHKTYGTWHLNERILKPGKAGRDRCQYLAVMLHVGHGKMVNKKIHRLVAETFLPRVDGKPCINHKDGNKENNCVDNLEWCTCLENTEHAWRTGLCQPIVDAKAKAVINLNTGEIFESISKAEAHYNLAAGSIQHAVSGKVNTSNGCEWQYYDEYKNNVKHVSRQNKTYSPVRQIDPQTGETIQTFSTIVEAARQLGVHATSIAQCCQGRSKRSYGYKWEYVNGYRRKAKE